MLTVRTLLSAFMPALRSPLDGNQILEDEPASFSEAVANVWSATAFSSIMLTTYAGPHVVWETHRGVRVMSLTALLFLGGAGLLSAVLGLGLDHVYTFTILAALALHIRVSSVRVQQVQALQLLAMLLLVVSGCALVLLVQQSGQLSRMLLLSVAMLFMLVPMVPWGLREAGATTGALYLMFTASTLFTRARFSAVDLWVLQLLMFMAALVSLVLVGRFLGARKHDLVMRYGLEAAHAQVERLANLDHLTGAWNRRHLETDFDRAVADHHAAGQDSYFAVFDIDRFKLLNDTLGHRTGDAVLKGVAAAFSDLQYPREYLVRLGGDEFVLLMHGQRVSERITLALAALGSFHNESGTAQLTPTVSLGLLRIPHVGITRFDEAYKLADSLLYAAKRAGGNRIRQRVPVQDGSDTVEHDVLLGQVQ